MVEVNPLLVVAVPCAVLAAGCSDRRDFCNTPQPTRPSSTNRWSRDCSWTWSNYVTSGWRYC